MLRVTLILLIGVAWATASPARGVYQQPEEFVSESFDGSPPQASVLWLTGEARSEAEDILGHPPGMLRVRYWGREGRTAWILEEIGKEQPITTGIVVDRGRIERLKVLIFRESRGWEVRHPFFTDQFKDAALTPDTTLDRSIDGISGATLSVRALINLSRLALFLHRQTDQADAAR